MTKSKVYLITGASSGLGLEIAKTALAEGNKVVATGRDVEKTSKAAVDVMVIICPDLFFLITGKTALVTFISPNKLVAICCST